MKRPVVFVIVAAMAFGMPTPELRSRVLDRQREAEDSPLPSGAEAHFFGPETS